MTNRLYLLVLIAGLLFSGHASAEAEQEESKTLHIATRHVPPFAIHDASGNWSGLSIDLWRLIAEQMNLRYEFAEQGLQPMLDAVANSKVDAAVAALTITSDRETRMDFTHPFLSSGLGIAVSSAMGEGWWRVVQRLVSGQFIKVVAGLTGLLFLVGFLVWLAERRRNDQFGGTPAQGIGAGLWWSAVTMTTVGYGDKAPQTAGGRALAIVWMFASVIIISSFTAAIATALTVGELNAKVQSKDDLARARLVSIAASTSAQYLDSRGYRYQTVNDVDEALMLLEEGEVDAVVYDAAILRYRVKRDFPRTLAVLPGSFDRQDYGIALPSGSPLREPLNRALLRVLQEPEWEAIQARYLGSE